MIRALCKKRKEKKRKEKKRKEITNMLPNTDRHVILSKRNTEYVVPTRKSMKRIKISRSFPLNLQRL